MTPTHGIWAQLGSTLLSQKGGTFWMPPQASTTAPPVDRLFGFILYVSLFFFALIVVLMLYFVWKYRRRAGVQAQISATHNTPLEVTWTLIPLVLVIVIFWLGFKGYLDLTTPPRNAYEIQVTGQKWNWLFTYPNGYVDATLHAPVDTPVTLTMSSQDVIHCIFIPAFRIKNDVVPGRYSKTWFRATDPGEYQIYCAEYCGKGHSDMLTTAIIHPPGDFELWLEKAGDILNTLPPEEAGARLSKMRGCLQCHTVDGRASTGPTFKGLFGHQQVLKDGSAVTVDENYIRESILEPQAKLAAGFDPVMPTFKGKIKDREIEAIIAYLKSLNE